MEGDIDMFTHKQMAAWKEPSKQDMVGAQNKVQAYLNTDNNYRIFKQNYLIEYDLILHNLLVMKLYLLPTSQIDISKISLHELKLYIIIKK